MAQRAPKASPAPSPHTTSTVTGGTRRRSPGHATSTPSPPSFTTASATPRSSSAEAAASGSFVPTAISHSARLPTATIAWSTAAPISRHSVVGRGPEHGAVVQVEHRMRPTSAGLEQRADGRSARLFGQRRGADPQHRHGGRGGQYLGGGLDRHVRPARLPVEQQLRVLRRVEGGERQRRAQRRMGADEAGVDAEVAERRAQVRSRTGRRRPS